MAALDLPIKPTELILDAPLSYDQGIGLPKWKPANYTKKFYGPSPMRLGIEKSRNLMTARLALLVTMKKIKMYAKKFDTDFMLLDEPNEKLKVVHYTGPNRAIHNLPDSPLYKIWINN